MQKTAALTGATGSAKLLEEYRKKNLEIFAAKPIKKSKYSSIARLDESLEKSNGNVKVKVLGAKLQSLREFTEKNQEMIGKILSMEEAPKDQFEAFVNANFSDSFVITVSGKTNAEITLEADEEACIKYFIIAEQNCEVQIMQALKGEAKLLCNCTLLVREGARVTLATLHLNTADKFFHQQSILEKDASFTNNASWFDGSYVRAKATAILAGEGSTALDYSILFGKGKKHYDLNYVALHKTTNSKSHAVFKAALKDECTNVFDGMIRIKPKADGTNALLECNSMILGEKARSNQIPGLEIETDEVKATHSATVERIEDEQLYYLQSRGIGKEDAKDIIVESFLESVVFLLPEGVRKPIKEEIGKQLSGK
ncbi:MAG: SufD family Fe-S cluster assembly protein [archaeon]